MTKKLIIIDDEKININLVKGLLENNYLIYAYESGDSFLNELNSVSPNIILLDINMPEKNGFEVLKEIKNNDNYIDVPVIFLTASSDELDEAYGINLGAVDYITKPFSPEILKERIKTHLRLQEALKLLKEKNAFLDQEVIKKVEEYKAIQDISFGILAQIVEQKDMQTAFHIFRTQSYVNIICKGLKNNSKYRKYLTDQVIENITKASIFHDIGKVGIPDQILLKSGKLSELEFNEMKKHVLFGKQAIDKAIRLIETSYSLSRDKIISTIEFFNIAKDIAYFHHERYDGNGYLNNLEGDQIPLAARIMSIADVFDALLSKRVYKEAWDFDETINYITNQRGKQFDPDIVDVFTENISLLIDVYEKNKD